jgi:hypothetical protein
MAAVPILLLALLSLARADDACVLDHTGVLVTDAPFDTVMRVEIDGTPVSFAERSKGRTLPAGPHHVTIVVDEGRTFEADVDVPACTRVEKLLDVGTGRWSDEPEPAAVAPTKASVDVVLATGVRAKLDGAPLIPGRQDLAKGEHTLDVDRPPCVQHFRVVVAAGDTLRLQVEPGGKVLLGSTRQGGGKLEPVGPLGSTCDVEIGESW